MSAPTKLCSTLSYVLKIETTSYQTGITQTASGCANSIDCQTTTFDTSSEKFYKFRFVITSNAQPGFEKLMTQILTQKIVCGAEVQTLSNSSITYVYDRSPGSETIDFQKDGIREMFSSNIKACDISRFDLFEEVDGNLVQWTNPSVEMVYKNKTNET